MLPTTVLVAEDDTDIAAYIATVLEDRGCTVIAAGDGNAAVMAAVRDHPDAIVMDVMMPGKNGFEALRELRSDPRTAHIPVILLTAVNDFELGVNHDRESAGRRNGVTPPEAFLEKPVRPEALIEALEAVMRR